MLKKWLREYIVVNKKEITTILAFLAIGLILGLLIFIFLPSDVKNLAINSAKEVFDISKSEEYIKTNVILNGIKTNAILVVVLLVASVTLFGKWVIYIVASLKGAMLTFYTIIIFKIFGIWWGILVAILLVILVNIIYIPAFIHLSVAYLEVNFGLFKIKINKENNSLLYNAIKATLISSIMMFSSVVVEQIVSPIVLEIYSKI